MSALALAILFFLLALRGVSQVDLPLDGKNHVLNGIFLLDWLQSGQLFHPVAYATRFYSHWPAITIPYHPPIFHLIEAAFFFLFGTKVEVARVLIAAFTSANVLLLHRLLMACGIHRIAALAATATFFGLSPALAISMNVMLEMPALFFTLAALLQLQPIATTDFSWRRALAFGLFSTLAIWTKQNAAFLAAVPLAYALLAARLRLLLHPPVWIATVVSSASAYAIRSLMFLQGGPSQSYIPSQTEGEVFLVIRNNFAYYLQGIWHDFGLFAPLALLTFLAALILEPTLRRAPHIRLLLTWTSAGLALLLPVGLFDRRYLLFIYPAMIALAFLSLDTLIRSWLRDSLRPAVFATFAAACCLYGIWTTPFPVLIGPAQAAGYVNQQGFQRVLYCGSWMGNFILATRLLKPGFETTVLRGDRLLGSYSPHEVEERARRYGADWVVVVRGYRERELATALLFDSPSPSMVLAKEFPIVTNVPAWRGAMRVFRFLNPSPNPEKPILKIKKLDRTIPSEF